jgi:hypothetical protein
MFDLGDSGDGNPCIVSLSSPVTNPFVFFSNMCWMGKNKGGATSTMPLVSKNQNCILHIYWHAVSFSFFILLSWFLFASECPLVILVEQTILKYCLQDSNIILSTCGPHVEFQAHMLICYITGTQVISESLWNFVSSFIFYDWWWGQSRICLSK